MVRMKIEMYLPIKFIFLIGFCEIYKPVYGLYKCNCMWSNKYRIRWRLNIYFIVCISMLLLICRCISIMYCVRCDTFFYKSSNKLPLTYYHKLSSYITPELHLHTFFRALLHSPYCVSANEMYNSRTHK